MRVQQRLIFQDYQQQLNTTFGCVRTAVLETYHTGLQVEHLPPHVVHQQCHTQKDSMTPQYHHVGRVKLFQVLELICRMRLQVHTQPQVLKKVLIWYNTTPIQHHPDIKND